MEYKIEVKRKVLIVSPTQGSYGGIEAFVLELARFLAQNSNFTVRICLKLVADYQIDFRLAHILLESNLQYSIVKRASTELMREIFSADVVHAQNASPDVAILARLSGKVLIQTIHNHLYDRGRVRTAAWKLGAKLANYHLYNSKFVQRSWEKREAHNSQVVPTVTQLHLSFAPIEGRNGFVFVSRLIANKGAETLVKAYLAARIDHTSWPLHILGDGPMRGQLMEQTKAHTEFITMHGFVSEESKLSRIRGARWLITPPNTKEDMGLTPLEARANGIPVIATRDGGIPESAGTQALFCEPGDVLGLTTLIEQATIMPDNEYLERSLGAFTSLRNHLVPMSFYPELYGKLLRQ